MSNRITVLPAAGRVVPDPEAGDLLPLEGREVLDSKTAPAKQKGAK
jgi:hypothetical protein